MAKLDLYYKKTIEPVSAYVFLNTPKVDEYSFTTPALEPSTSYDFKWVMDGHEDVIKTVVSSSYSVQPGTPLTASTSFTANVVANNRIDLSWNLDPNASSYIIRRASNAAFTSGIVNIYSGAANTFSDTTVQPGQKYWYEIVKVGQGNYTNSPATIIEAVSIFFNNQFNGESLGGYDFKYNGGATLQPTQDGGSLVIAPPQGVSGRGGLTTNFEIDLAGGYIETRIIQPLSTSNGYHALHFAQGPAGWIRMVLEAPQNLLFQKGNDSAIETFALTGYDSAVYNFWKIECLLNEATGLYEWRPKISKDGTTWVSFGAYSVINGTVGRPSLGADIYPSNTMQPGAVKFDYFKAAKY